MPDTAVLEAARRLAADAVQVVHQEGPPEEGAGSRVVVVGDVSGFALGDLFAALALGRWSGVVRVRAGELEREVGLRDGRVVQATSSAAEDGLDTVLARSRHGRRGRLRPAEVAAAARRQAEEIFYAMLAMGPGAFFLIAGPVSPASGVELDLHHLLLEGMRREDEAGRTAPVTAGE